jgi:rod shape-determining protein MreD
MSALLPLPRALAALVAVSVALVLQTSFFAHVAVQGVVPDLVLLVVVAAALAHGSELGLVLGFGAGLLLDLAPPADHDAGRWALALMVVGYVAGRFATSGPPRVGQWLPVAVACSFVGTSVFALTGLVLRDPAVGVGELLRVEVAALVWDVALALIVVPVTLWFFAKVEPDRVLASPPRKRVERALRAEATLSRGPQDP